MANKETVRTTLEFNEPRSEPTGNTSNEAYLAEHPEAVVDVDKAELMAHAGKRHEEKAQFMGKLAEASASEDTSGLTDHQRMMGRFHVQEARRKGSSYFDSLEAATGTSDRTRAEVEKQGFRVMEAEARQDASGAYEGAGKSYDSNRATYAQNLATLKADPEAVAYFEERYGKDTVRKHYPDLYEDTAA